MVSLRLSRRGASSLGCLVSAALFLAAAYYGIHLGGIYWRYYQLLDDMRQQAIFARQNTDDVIQRRLMAQADSLLGGTTPRFRIQRTNSRVIIDTEYTESVDLPLLKKTFTLRPRAEEPL
ncbi:MAG TPA: hypothetical protein VJQ46_09125 [Gemmatimonadales bacterium]|nr:hypothetical protein [Gemmatimonadales bacterium]